MGLYKIALCVTMGIINFEGGGSTPILEGGSDLHTIDHLFDIFISYWVSILCATQSY